VPLRRLPRPQACALRPRSPGLTACLWPYQCTRRAGEGYETDPKSSKFLQRHRTHSAGVRAGGRIHLGRLDEARSELDRVLTINPSSRLAVAHSKCALRCPGNSGDFHRWPAPRRLAGSVRDTVLRLTRPALGRTPNGRNRRRRHACSERRKCTPQRPCRMPLAVADFPESRLSDRRSSRDCRALTNR